MKKGKLEGTIEEATAQLLTHRARKLGYRAQAEIERSGLRPTVYTFVRNGKWYACVGTEQTIAFLRGVEAAQEQKGKP